MVGSPNAAGAGTAAKGRHFRCVFFGTSLVLSVLLGACGAVPPTMPLQPAALHRPIVPALAGLSAAEVVGLFGEPDFRRVEPPAELWQYRGADCVLDLFLYSDPSGVRVVHSEMRERTLVQSGHCRGGDGFARLSRESRL
jgi:hypothetical protein